MARGRPWLYRSTNHNRYALRKPEQVEYIGAARCLICHPPITRLSRAPRPCGTSYIHYAGHLFPWYYYYLAHELLLQRVCGYKGAPPYWDKLGAYESGPIHEAAIFDPDFGFGGDPPLATTRPFNHETFCWANRSNVEGCFAVTDYNDTWQCSNKYPHSYCCGSATPGDPIFYLHPAYLDRLWWQWQQADEANRLTAIRGVNVPPQANLDLVDYSGDEGDMTTLRYVLWVHRIIPNVTVADVLD
ncbi:hypothetical protein BJX63DRAFT_421479 [Aspergillus granulosus]|uniref:Tyrosinase copper-binding domain-containing protein n=1 Tax=Aspergillus granulosus TaxID=176169 RepID=A0ABR4HCM5_9EURO